nr:hypothetical protein [Nonomuraea diastatica]
MSERTALGAADGRDHGADPAVRVADEVRAVAEQLGDVVGVGQVVAGEPLTGVRAAAVPAPVHEQQADAAGERRLGGEAVARVIAPAGGAVHEEHRRRAVRAQRGHVHAARQRPVRTEQRRGARRGHRTP